MGNIDIERIVNRERAKLAEIETVMSDIPNMTDEKFDIISIEQVWGNTSGGFEGMGGSQMITEYTHIAVTKESKRCYVYFAGEFAYSADFTEDFALDIIRCDVKGLNHCSKYKNVEYSKKQ